LAVAIMAMVAMAIYRFVSANINAVRISSIQTAADARYTGFISLLNSQMQDLSNEGGISGEPFKMNEQSQDEVSWRSVAGPGVLTRYASGEYIVTLKLKRGEGENGKMAVGFIRKPTDTPEGSDEGVSWVPLLDDVRGLEVRYFDPRLPAWVDKWTDPKVMPRLIRIVIGRPDRTEPMETILALGRTPLQIQPPQPLQQQQQQPQNPQNPQNPTGQPQPGQSPPGKDLSPKK
jgi:hypothetical protein